jgi:predicted transcriptional regulator
MDNNKNLEKKLDIIIEMMQHLLALEFSKNGVTQEVVAKKLHIAKASVVGMLKGIKKE